MKTLIAAPSFSGSRSATRLRMTPACSSARTRARQGEGDRPTFSASSTLVMLASSCNADKDAPIDGVDCELRRLAPGNALHAAYIAEKFGSRNQLRQKMPLPLR